MTGSSHPASSRGRAHVFLNAPRHVYEAHQVPGLGATTAAMQQQPMEQPGINPSLHGQGSSWWSQVPSRGPAGPTGQQQQEAWTAEQDGYYGPHTTTSSPGPSHGALASDRPRVTHSHASRSLYSPAPPSAGMGLSDSSSTITGQGPGGHFSPGPPAAPAPPTLQSGNYGRAAAMNTHSQAMAGSLLNGTSSNGPTRSSNGGPFAGSGYQPPGGEPRRFLSGLRELRPGLSEEQRRHQEVQRRKLQRDLDEQVRDRRDREARAKAEAEAARQKEEAELRVYQQRMQAQHLAEQHRAHKTAAAAATATAAPRHSLHQSAGAYPTPSAPAARVGEASTACRGPAVGTARFGGSQQLHSGAAAERQAWGHGGFDEAGPAGHGPPPRRRGSRNVIQADWLDNLQSREQEQRSMAVEHRAPGMQSGPGGVSNKFLSGSSEPAAPQPQARAGTGGAAGHMGALLQELQEEKARLQEQLLQHSGELGSAPHLRTQDQAWKELQRIRQRLMDSEPSFESGGGGLPPGPSRDLAEEEDELLPAGDEQECGGTFIVSSMLLPAHVNTIPTDLSLHCLTIDDPETGPSWPPAASQHSDVSNGGGGRRGPHRPPAPAAAPQPPAPAKAGTLRSKGSDQALLPSVSRPVPKGGHASLAQAHHGPEGWGEHGDKRTPGHAARERGGLPAVGQARRPVSAVQHAGSPDEEAEELAAALNPLKHPARGARALSAR